MTAILIRLLYHVASTRQHLAAVKPQKKGLMLELMHFPEELLEASEFKAPAAKSIRKNEMQMAMNLPQFGGHGSRK
jgi:DNA end-binding protein Ku